MRNTLLLALIVAPVAAQDAPSPVPALTRSDGGVPVVLVPGLGSSLREFGLPGRRGSVPFGPPAKAWGAGRALVFPSPRFPTLQRAIDFAPDGATIRVRAGTYDLPAPLVISGKRLRILGAGSGRRHGRITHLRGPRPTGNPEPLRARGVVHYENGGGILANLKITGLDGVTAKGDSPGLRVHNVEVSHSGFGCVWAANANLVVTGSAFIAIENSGLYVANGFLSMFNVEVKDIGDIGIFIDTTGDCSSEEQNLIEGVTVAVCNVGILVHTGGACIRDCIVGACYGGGIWIIQSAVWVQDCYLFSNYAVGIGVIESQGVLIENNEIKGTQPHFHLDVWGDGIAIVAGQVQSTASILNNTVANNDRAGVSNFGSEIWLQGNKLNYNAFDIDNETHNGFAAVLNDAGGNACLPGGQCSAVSVGLEPPQPD